MEDLYKKDSLEIMVINEKKNTNMIKEKDKKSELEKNLIKINENKIEIENITSLNLNKNFSFLLNPIHSNFPSTIYFKKQEEINSQSYSYSYLNSNSNSNKNKNLDLDLQNNKREIREIIWDENSTDILTNTDEGLLSKNYNENYKLKIRINCI
jgi:hypothetical protein